MFKTLIQSFKANSNINNILIGVFYHLFQFNVIYCNLFAINIAGSNPLVVEKIKNIAFHEGVFKKNGDFIWPLLQNKAHLSKCTHKQ